MVPSLTAEYTTNSAENHFSPVCLDTYDWSKTTIGVSIVAFSPVSSSTSRSAASFGFSPSSTTPPGRNQLSDHEFFTSATWPAEFLTYAEAVSPVPSEAHSSSERSFDSERWSCCGSRGAAGATGEERGIFLRTSDKPDAGSAFVTYLFFSHHRARPPLMVCVRI